MIFLLHCIHLFISFRKRHLSYLHSMMHYALLNLSIQYIFLFDDINADLPSCPIHSQHLYT